VAFEKPDADTGDVEQAARSVPSNVIDSNEVRVARRSLPPV
jgi:hypothetical protein